MKEFNIAFKYFCKFRFTNTIKFSYWRDKILIIEEIFFYSDGMTDSEKKLVSYFLIEKKCKDGKFNFNFEPLKFVFGWKRIFIKETTQVT